MESKTVEGYLHKWTNYLKGYQRRYFVLQDGLLSYYRNTAEITRLCRGTINIINTKISILDNNSFTISHRNIPNLHLKAPNESELNRWTKSIIAAQNKAKDLRKDYLLDDGEMDSAEYFGRSLRHLKIQLDDLKENNDLLSNKFDDLLRSISDLERDKNVAMYSEAIMKIKTVKERATICRVTLAKSIYAQNNYVNSFNKESEKIIKSTEKGYEQKQRLELMIEQLGKQLRNLEKTIQKKKQSSLISRKSFDKCSEASEDNFYDAYDTQEVLFDPSLLNADENSTKLVIVRDNSRSKLPNNGTGAAGSRVSGGGGSERRVSDFSLGFGEEEESDEDDEDEDIGFTDLDFSQKHQTNFGDMDVKVGVNSRKISSAPHHHQQGMASSSTANHRSMSASAKSKMKDKPGGRDMTMNNASPLKSTTDFSNLDAKSIFEIVKFNQIPIREPKIRRKTIPPKPNFSMNLWSVVKNSIGKDLSKIPMPVNFSEPISMLQRLAEDFEYSSILDKAAEFSSPIEQLPYIAAFSVSSYAATALRVNKPFNPLLGETYELDRTDDLGWRLIAEQVQHHPPECAVHCESNEWKCWFKFSMSNKFRGKYLQIDPIGQSHLVFKNTQCHYVWNKVPMTIHNIIVGKIWIDNHGDIDIVSCTTGDKCHLSYKQYSMFSADVPRRVTGVVYDKANKPHYMLNGTWDERLEAREVIHPDLAHESDKKIAVKNQVETSKTVIPLWERTALVKDSDKVYYFSLFSLSLNETDEDVAPTDSRHRPDQRLMEEGRWEEANKEKTRLEDEQRARKIEITKPDGSKELTYYYKPIWFSPVLDPDTKTLMYLANDRYWECKQKGDWSMCQKLF